MHAISDWVCFLWLDATELICIQKFYFPAAVNNFGWIRRWVRLEDQSCNTLSVPCEFAVPSSVFQDPDAIRTYFVLKIFVLLGFCLRELEVGPFGQTATTCLCHGSALSDTGCLELDATPKSSNAYSKIKFIRFR